MNEKDFKIRTSIIKETFNNQKSIKCHIPTEELELDENIRQEGDFFLAEDGEIIDLEFQLTDFTEEELAKYVELAESLYEKYGNEVSIYVICPKNIKVHVREFDIPSYADFTIRLSCVNMDMCKVILNGINDKIKNNEIITEEDLMALGRLPSMCEKEEKFFYLLQYLKVANHLKF